MHQYSHNAVGKWLLYDGTSVGQIHTYRRRNGAMVNNSENDKIFTQDKGRIKNNILKR